MAHLSACAPSPAHFSSPTIGFSCALDVTRDIHLAAPALTELEHSHG